jgi:hypothetical protein
MHSGGTFALVARLRYDQLERPPAVLPLVVDITSREDEPRTWRRNVPVDLKAGPWFEYV